MAGSIWYSARNSEAVKSDVSLVMGAAQFDGRPSDILKSRLEHALDIYKAGYAPNSAAVEGSRQLQKPKIQKYLQARSNEVNRSFTVTKNNYVRRQQVLSQTLVDQGKIEKALGFENLIGKATGQFMDIHIHGNLNDLTKAEKLDEIKRIKELQKDRLDANPIMITSKKKVNGDKK